ncbi:MAG: EpsG family protein [Lacrimispora saccharolytica]
MIYFVTFCLSGLFFQLAKYEKNKIAKNVTYFIAIMIPVMLSAMRGLDVGADTRVYAYPVFQYARGVDHFSELVGYDGIEPAFLFIEYIGAKYLNSFAFVLGTMQLIIDYCFYKFIRKNYGEDNLAIIMMIFYFFIYGSTLNAIRQSVATGLILLASSYFSEKKYVIAAVLLILSFMFHTTAAIALVFLAIYAIADKDRIYKAVNIFIIAFSFILNFGWNIIFSTIFNYVAIWSNNYSDYLIYGKAGERNETSILCGIIALIIICLVNKKTKSKWNRLLISISLIFVFYQPITEKLYVASRLLLYPQAFMITIFPSVKNLVHFKNGNRDASWACDVLIFVFFFSIWFYTVIINNSNSILPFSFM